MFFVLVRIYMTFCTEKQGILYLAHCSRERTWPRWPSILLAIKRLPYFDISFPPFKLAMLDAYTVHTCLPVFSSVRSSGTQQETQSFTDPTNAQPIYDAF